MILNDERNPPIATLVGRLKSELVLKLIFLVTLLALVYAPYFFLQRHHFFATNDVPVSFFDRLIPFSDQAVWPYLSIYLLMPVGPFLMKHRDQIFGYVTGAVLISLVADIIFLFWPTTCPRSPAASTNMAYLALTAVDNSFHAFPSLHAAFAVYSALCAGLVFRELGVGRRWRFGIWVWTFWILYATLATKQHVLMDILAGSTLGFMAYAAVFGHKISIFKDKRSLQPIP
jgi:membrane-associated phospholipid phosphatase